MAKLIFQRTVWLLLLWWIVSENLPGGSGLGLVAILAALTASLYLLPPGTGRIRIGPLLGFLLHFVWNSLLAGLQVTRLAFRGPKALNPAMLDLELALPVGPPALLLVNAIGLMPGTLGVSLTGNRLRLHTLDARLPVEAEIRALEDRIRPIFGVPS